VQESQQTLSLTAYRCNTKLSENLASTRARSRPFFVKNRAKRPKTGQNQGKIRENGENALFSGRPGENRAAWEPCGGYDEVYNPGGI